MTDRQTDFGSPPLDHTMAHLSERRAGVAKVMMGDHFDSPLSDREGAINPKPVPRPQSKRIQYMDAWRT
jgi:hypothetical protein